MQMNLKEQIENDLKSSMKSGDNTVRGVLRMLFSDLKNVEINERKEISDEKIIEIIKKNIKSRKDSVEQYTKGNRKDLASQEEKELEILEKYMPEQMGEDEIRKIVVDIVSKSEAVSASDFGRIMGAVMKEIGGNVDGNLVGGIVREELK
ncbi:GatB/YqeY domain-containing protein [Candidatus Parcubacteria bacterium]|nr:GatB/YqeY domain-containing protein [Candidatus Parcubacteria bacterium]